MSRRKSITGRHASRLRALLRDTGSYRGLTEAEYVAARQAIEDLIGLDEHSAVEARTVEARKPR